MSHSHGRQLKKGHRACPILRTSKSTKMQFRGKPVGKGRQPSPSAVKGCTSGCAALDGGSVRLEGHPCSRVAAVSAFGGTSDDSTATTKDGDNHGNGRIW